MENVPKIVTDRLRADTVNVDHPDADLLTAFSERTLSGPERSQVLEHLARCSECREVVALGLPAQEAMVPVLRPARGGLLTWPRLRWALAAVGVLVVGSFGVLFYRATSHPQTAALYDSHGTADAAKEASGVREPAPVPLAASKSDEEKPQVPPSKSPAVGAKNEAQPESKEFDRLEQFANVEAPRRDEKIDFGSGSRVGRVRSQALPHGPSGPVQQWQQNMNANATNTANAFQYQGSAPAAPSMAGKQAVSGVLVTAESEAPAEAAPTIGGPLPSSADKKGQNLDLAVNGRSIAPLPRSGAGSGAEVARAKPAEPATANTPASAAAGAYTISAANASNFAPSGSLVPESARWAITSAGGLQRSFDQGKTWQDVDVNSGPGATSAANLQLAMKTHRAKALAKDKAELKMTPIVFRAVSANGPDVWAGGSEANLYHSNDAGVHWVRVVPSWRGIELTGDVVNLQFADPQHGRIITSSAEIWTTADAGQTWDKQ